MSRFQMRKRWQEAVLAMLWLPAMTCVRCAAQTALTRYAGASTVFDFAVTHTNDSGHLGNVGSCPGDAFN
jgi:hypothetical protein